MRKSEFLRNAGSQAHPNDRHQCKHITKKDFVMGLFYNIRGHCVELSKPSATEKTST